MNIPIVDADGMGRAFPELQMVTPTMYGISATPMAIGDEKGNRAVINTPTNRWTETVARTITIDMGSTALIALYPMTGRQLKEGMVLSTLSHRTSPGPPTRTTCLLRQTRPFRRLTAASHYFRAGPLPLPTSTHILGAARRD